MTTPLFYVPLTFGLTVLLTFYLLISTLQPTLSRSNLFIVIGLLVLWMGIQTGLSLSGFYQVQTRPPRFLLLVGPPMLTIIILLVRRKSRAVLQTISLERLTWIHLVRIPVELVLLWLFLYRQIPVEMTFEGRNPDILSGITAPLVAYFGIRQGRMSRGGLLVWNLVCLGLLINIVATSVLSAPSPFQRFGFDQPNVGLARFPFVLLPGFIVPVVLWSHLTAIIQLTRARRSTVSVS